MKRIFAAPYALVIVFALGLTILAQTDDVDALKAQGRALIATQKFLDALPIYEKLAKLAPKDSEVFRNLGFSLLAQATNTRDAATARQLRVRAREAFVRAHDLGDDSLMVKGIIDGLPVDGAPGAGFSDNAEANRAMQEAEAFFSQGKLDDAFKSYQKALALDPRCYYAALFSGDVMTQGGNWDEAEKWYQRAIGINPYIETAYRYSATPFMRQKKFDQARDRYVEAFIVSPYDKLARSGIVQWSETTQTPIGHPKIDIPRTTTGPDGKPNTTINVTGAEDGSMGWAAYTATRDVWKLSKFAKVYPGERTYRHSVGEEADALRQVVSAARSLKPKQLNGQIALIEKMDKDGVLEAFVLMALADRDIAREYDDYLRAHRDKLRQYVVNYVIGK